MAKIPNCRFKCTLCSLLGGDYMEEFIKTLTEQIRCVKAREGIARELSDHILDQSNTYEQSGMSHEEALEKAVLEMGDPVETGIALDRIHRPQLDWKMLLMTFVFSIAGFLIMLTVGKLSEYYPATRQFLFMLISFGIIIGVYFLDYSFLGKYGLILYIALTAVFFFHCKTAVRIHGRIPGMSFLVSLYAPVYAGVLYQLRGKGYSAILKGIAMLFLTIVLGNTFATSSTILNLYFICAAILMTAIYKKWFQVNKKWALAALILILLVIPVLIVLYITFLRPDLTSFRVMRLRAILDPNTYKTGAGYIYTVIHENLSNSKLIGIGKLPSSEIFIKESTFYPLLLIGSYGRLAGYVLALAIVLFLLRAFYIVRRQKNQLGFIISVACLLTFSLNCCEIFFINIGTFPATSLLLPFLTYGGSATLTHAVFIGLLLSIHRHEKIVSDCTYHSNMKLKQHFQWLIKD